MAGGLGHTGLNLMTRLHGYPNPRLHLPSQDPGSWGGSATALRFLRYICLGGSAVPSPSDGTHGYRCSPGFRCPPGAHSELPCEPGTFSPLSGADTCLPCPAGTYCPKATSVEPTICPKGNECPRAGLCPGSQGTGTLGMITVDGTHQGSTQMTPWAQLHPELHAVNKAGDHPIKWVDHTTEGGHRKGC